MQLVAHLINLAFGTHFALCGAKAIDLSGARKREQQEEDASIVPVDSSVLTLNSHIFKGNVLKHNAYVKRWVVLYCLPWFPPCQRFQELYNVAAKEEQQARNTGIWVSEVRFAQVNCATDKVLCNDMNVGMMPLLAMYENQHEAARLVWGNDNKNPSELLHSFLDSKLAKGAQSRTRTPPSAWLNNLVLKCSRWLETTWLGRMWFGLDQDARSLIGLVVISLSIWLLVKVFVLRVPHDLRKQCDDYMTEKCPTVMPQYVLLNAGSKWDDPACIRKEAVLTGASQSAEELRRRTSYGQPRQVSGSIIL